MLQCALTYVLQFQFHYLALITVCPNSVEFCRINTILYVITCIHRVIHSRHLKICNIAHHKNFVDLLPLVEDREYWRSLELLISSNLRETTVYTERQSCTHTSLFITTTSIYLSVDQLSRMYRRSFGTYLLPFLICSIKCRWYLML